jgi:hypothetical protein
MRDDPLTIDRCDTLVDLAPTLTEGLLDIAARQSVPQVPPKARRIIAGGNRSPRTRNVKSR